MQDLSLVTDALAQILNDALAANPLWGGGPPPFSVSVSGQHPELPPTGSDCELNLYLFHIGADKFLSNSFWTQQSQSGGPTGLQPVAFEPLCLDLWYLLSAQSKTSYVQEQQVLGAGMKAFHEHGTFTIAAPTPPPNPVTPSEATLVLESPTFDELSRLWQALGLALRTTAQYRVSVVFLTPEDLPQPEPPVQTVQLVAAAANLPADPSLPMLLGTRRTITYVAPPVVGLPPDRSFEQSPAATAPAPTGVGGQVVTLDARGLQDTDRVLLVSFAADGTPTETDVTATWRVPLAPPYPSPPAHGVPFLLRAPATGAVPPPGRYQIQVARPSVAGWRSNGVPVEIAPWVDPSGGPLLAAAAGIYTLDVRNVPAPDVNRPEKVNVRLGTVPLTPATGGGALHPGEWRLSGNTLTFTAPTNLATGHHAVRVRAADVEADPAQWAVI